MFGAVRAITHDQVTAELGSGHGSAPPIEPDIELGPLFNIAQDMLCVASVDGYLQAVNPAWQRTLGWTDEELTSRPYVEFIHPADRHAAPTVPDVLIAGQHVVHYENRWRTRDGSFRWISWMATPSPVPRVLYAAGHDITKAKLEGQIASAKAAITKIAAEFEGWDDAAWHVLQAVCTCLHWDIGALWLVDPGEQQLTWKQAYFGSDDLRERLGAPLRNDRRRLGESLVGLAWERDEPLFSEDVLSDTRFAAPQTAAQAGLGAGFAFPIRHAGEVIGVMGFGSREVEHLDADLRTNLWELATQVEDLMATLATRRDTYYMAFHDALTGLPNRALFRERAGQALLMSGRLKMPVGIGLADIDRFKEINDTLGHAAGDRVLRHVGSRLVEVLRGSDTVARLGGDEFAILFPATSIDGVERAMRKLRTALARGLTVEGLEPIHVSLGCALAPRGDMSLDDLLKMADADMYRRKRSRSQGLEERRRSDHVTGADGDTTDLRGMSHRPVGQPHRATDMQSDDAGL